MNTQPQPENSSPRLRARPPRIRAPRPRVLVVGPNGVERRRVSEYLNHVRRFAVTSLSVREFEEDPKRSGEVAVFVLDRPDSAVVSLPPFIVREGRRIPIVPVGTRGPFASADPRAETSKLAAAEGAPELAGAAPHAEILSWPAEREALLELLSRGLGRTDNQLASRESRATLIRDARLRHALVAEADGAAPTIPVEVRGEEVLVNVDAKARASMARIAEVSARIDPMLRLERVSSTNGEPMLLRRRVREARRLLRDHPEVEARNFVVAPALQALVLLGSAEGERELRRVVTAVRAAAGALPIDNLLVIDREQRRKDIARARRIQSALRHHPIGDLDLAVSRNHVHVAAAATHAECARSIRQVVHAESPGLLVTVDLELPN